MKVARYGLAVLVLAMVCGLAAAEDIVPGKLVEKVEPTPGFSYALYLPSGYDSKKLWPVVFVLDPMARGGIAAEGFVAGAERYGYIVAASNDSRNGPMRSDAIGAMWDDVIQRFSVDTKRIYAAGMSGGARAAMTVAVSCQACAVAGVIACAAGIADAKHVPPKGLMFYGIAGVYDFNYPELQRTMERLEAQHLTHRFESWPGSHGWAPASVLEDALGWLRLQEIMRGSVPRDAAFLNTFFEREMEKARQLTAKGQRYEAYLVYKQAVADFATLRDMSELKKKVESLAASKEVKEGARTEQRLMQWQSEYEEPALQAISQIASGSQILEFKVNGVQAAENLRLRVAKEKDAARVTALKRALGAITIGAYEAAHRTKQAGNHAGTSALLEIVIAAQPDDPDALYSAAREYAVAGDKKKALRTLREAVEKGFRDVELLAHDKELDSLRGDAEFEKMVGSVRR